MSLIYEKKTIDGLVSLSVASLDTPLRFVNIPAVETGLPIRAINSHAFEGQKEIEELLLPDGLISVGGFAFSKCVNLKKLSLTDSVQVFADTALRQCDCLSLISVRLVNADTRVLPLLLDAVEKEISLEIIYPDGEARLLFPYYNYLYTENTMARVFMFNIEGCGLAYRECVTFNGVNFYEYDRLFERSRREDTRAAAYIALYRLAHPYGLSAAAQNMYSDYFKSDGFLNTSGTSPFLDELVKTSDSEAARFLTEKKLLSSKATELILNKAAVEKKPMLTARLMEYLHTEKQEVSERMTL